VTQRIPDEEGYEIEVVTAPPPRPRRRAENPAVDEAIQSGEIVLPRSTVIRSQSSPAIEVPPAEPPAPVPVAVPNRRPSVPTLVRRRARFVWLLLAVIPLAGAIGFAFVKSTPGPVSAPKTVELDAVAQLVGTTLDAEARAALIRAEAIASSPTLRAAIQTDAGTLADMAKDHDIVLPSGPDEALEVFQDSPTGRKSMLRIPTGAPSVPPPGIEKTRLEQRGDRLLVVADAKVTSASSADGDGEIVLTTPIDLSAIQKRSYVEVTGVELTGFGKPITLGGGDAAANGERVTAKVTTTLDTQSLAVNATVPIPEVEPQSQSLLRIARGACIGLVVIFLIGFALSFRR
jgi:hypothetical protein